MLGPESHLRGRSTQDSGRQSFDLRTIRIQMIRPILALLAASVVAAPLAAQFTLTPEKAVTTPVTGPSDRVEGFGGIDVIDVESADDQLLIVWTERRSDASNDIFAARVNSAGEVLDPTNILVATGAANDTSPRIVWTGSRFIVAWSAYEGGTVRTRAAQIDVNGRVLEPNGVDVTEGRLQSLVYNGLISMLAVQRPVPAGSTPRIGIGTLSTTLAYTNIADFGEAIAPQVVTYGGGGLAVIWMLYNSGAQHYIVELQLFDRDGRRIGGVRPLGELGSFTGTPTLTAGASGSDAIIAGAGDNVIRAARLFADGTARAGTGLTAPPGQHVVVDAGGPGMDVLAVVNGVLTLYRFNSSDALTSTLRPASLTLWGRMAAHKGKQFLTWVTAPSPGVANVFASFDPVGDPVLVSRSMDSQQVPALATDGTSVLGVWTQDKGTTYDAVIGRLMDRTGTPFGVPFAIADGSHPTESPVATFNGTDYIVVWQELRRPSDEMWTTVQSRRVGVNGLPADVVQISPNAYIHSEPAVATDGRNVLITWTDAGGGFKNPELRAAILAPNRYIMPTSIALPALFSPAAAWNGASYVIVAETSGPALRAMVVNGDGALVTSADATVPPAALTDTEPSIAWGGSTHLVVYRRGTTIAGTFLDRNGARASADFQIAASGSDPAVVWDGSSFVVTWESGSTYRDVLAARVTPGGTLIGNPIVIAGDPVMNESDAALLPLGAGRTLVAYQRLVPEMTGVHRVFTRILGLPGRHRAVRH